METLKAFLLFASIFVSSFASASPIYPADVFDSIETKSTSELQSPFERINIGDWIKFRATSTFKFSVPNNLPEIDGYKIVVTKISCTTTLLSPVGSPLGTETRDVVFPEVVQPGSVGVWTQEKKGCVNAYECSYELGIDGLDDPNSRRTFGPVSVKGSTTGPYDCFAMGSDEPIIE